MKKESNPVPPDNLRRPPPPPPPIPQFHRQSGYKIKVYVAHGYYEYSVPEMASALEHAQVIAERGVYRRSRDDGAVEFHRVVKVKVEGEGLASEYPDRFVRT